MRKEQKNQVSAISIENVERNDVSECVEGDECV